MLQELLCRKIAHLTELANDVGSSVEVVAVALTLCRTEETGYGQVCCGGKQILCVKVVEYGE